MAIIKQTFNIHKHHREAKNRHRSFVIWLTGLSGSGKSIIANLTEEILFAKGYNTYVLDGDNIRLGINKDLDFSKEGREENIRRVSEIANLFCDAGIIVITAFISPYLRDRELAREVIGKANFIEVFVDAPIQTCANRDTKGLYSKANKGVINNFTGIGDIYETPVAPQIHLNTQAESVSETTSKLIAYLVRENFIVE